VANLSLQTLSWLVPRNTSPPPVFRGTFYFIKVVLKLYTFYTPSHALLYENYFLPSLPQEFELIAHEHDQQCLTAVYHSQGWRETVFKKIGILIDACKANMGDCFVFSDVDVQFFWPCKQVLLNELGDFDIACQYDLRGQHCAGFFICRANAATLALFEKMRDDYGVSDQPTMNKHISMCKAKFLSHKFYTVARSLDGLWTGQDVDVPVDILVHHANWVEGVQGKARLLELVRSKFLA